MRNRSLSPRLALAAMSLIAVGFQAGRANADITVFDQDGWTLRVSGLVAAHYQLINGDADPNGRLNLAGGRILDEGASANEADPMNRTLTMSDIRSGFIGTQVGFGINRQITQTVHVDSFFGLNVAGINSNRGQDLPIPKEVDFREAWAAIVGPAGTLKFGRMFGMFGEGSAEVQILAWKYGVGHPCVVNHATISCGSSGAGPIYPGFDAAIRYISPRMAGFQLAVSIADPTVSPKLKISPYPRVDTELNYDQNFGALHVRLIGQTMWERIGKTDLTDPLNAFVAYKNVWGAMGTGIISIAGLTLGGGGWQGQGIGERIPLEANDAANPISNDNTGVLRTFRGFYANAQYAFAGNTVTVGGGELFVKPTAQDELRVDNLVLTNQYEGHVVLTHSWDSIAVNVEYTNWHTLWIEDAPNPRVKQTLNFVGAGVNYFF